MKAITSDILSMLWFALIQLSAIAAIPLLNGRFETSTDVQNFLNLALDAAAMRESKNMTEKSEIYSNGIERGKSASGEEVSLQSLSLNAKSKMSHSPMFNIFRHAFLVLGTMNEGEVEGNFDGSPIEEYGNTLVNDLFELSIDGIETEAALVTNVWMAAVHELFQVLRQCKATEEARAMASLDKAAALWIGEGQIEGSNEQGHMLYNLAEIAGERFDQDDGETLVNTQIVDRLLTIQSSLHRKECGDENSYTIMRANVKRLIGLMTVPLVQNLIHHSMNLQTEGGSSYVELYALATIPRVAACDPEAYEQELNLDVLTELTPNQVKTSIKAIQKAYTCLQVTCSQVGSYLGGSVPECQDDSTLTLAGYRTDRVAAKRKLHFDRDVKEIDIFLRFEAYDAAEDWYSYGWNTDNLSLRDLATNRFVPSAKNSYISIYQNYYGKENFAHDMITNMLGMAPPYSSAEKEQVRNLVTGMLSYVVMFMTTASSLQYAVDSCKEDKATALDFWDTGAIFYVGSMEGADNDGSNHDGASMFATASELCQEFGTCVKQATDNNGLAIAAANDVVLEGLKQGADMINDGLCSVVRGILESQLLPTMIIPLFQGTIKYASYNAGLASGSAESSLAIGDTYARGILPIVDQSDPNSATTIMTNMEFDLSLKPVSDGFAVVADALRTVLTSMATSCSDIGDFEDEPSDGSMCKRTPPSGSTGQNGNEPLASATQSLAFGRYKFRNLDIEDGDASFALDIRDMFEATNMEEARAVYSNGTNAITDGLYGSTGIFSLESIGRKTPKSMEKDIMFNIFKYAIYRDEDLEESNEFMYAHAVVEQTLTKTDDTRLAAETVVVLHIWMLITHRLYEAVRLCRKRQDPVPLIDSAVALWIGKDQKEGTFDQGWMLYSIGQSTAEFYGLQEGEAAVNTKLMELFNEAQDIGDRCVDTEDAAHDMHFQVQELVRNLSRPLILNLLFHLVGESKNMLELYAVSVVPQAVACNEDVGGALMSELFHGSPGDSLTDGLLDNLAAFLKCQRITLEDLRHTNSAPLELRNLLNTLQGRIGVTSGRNHRQVQNSTVVGYDAATDVSDISRLDLDALEIKILMRTKAYEAAKDIYELGHNVYADSPSRYLSLKSLAMKGENSASELPRAVFQQYYNTRFPADDFINNAMARTGDFGGATRKELSEIVTRTIQTMVLFDAVFDRMRRSRESCILENGGGSSSMESSAQWDQAVALFVGSSQGPIGGGKGRGLFLYSLGNELCADFGSCEASGEAQLTEDILVEFSAGRDAITESNCGKLERIGAKIKSLVHTALLQGTISFASRIQAEQHAESRAKAFVLAKSITPFVDQRNSTSSATISAALGNFKTIGPDQPIKALIEAFAYVLRGLNIDCSDIGALNNNPDLLVCLGTVAAGESNSEGNVPDEAPVAETPTDLGDGLYVTTTYVQDRANIAKDILDFREALESNSYRMAELIYKDGKNSEIFDSDGKFGSLRSLKSFSTQETNDMLDEPLFNIFMYALGDEAATFMSRDVRVYADSIVENAFKNLSSKTRALPVEAALVLNLWMHIAHLLYKTLKDCKDKDIWDEDGVHSMDIAVAYWIGDGQIAGSGDNGHLLYAMAERMGERFAMDQGGQSRTNTNILKLFNQAKHEISLPGACSDDPSSYLRLSGILSKIVSLMAVPLIQALIHNLRIDDRPRVKLYAHAVIPLAAGCSPSVFEYLKQKLLHMTYNVVETEDIITSIRRIYPCLGLSCSDIGTHESEMTDPSIECKDPDTSTMLAGYKPKYGVNDFARMDLDLRQLDILLKMKAYRSAENLYTFGQHATTKATGTSMSLYHMATTNDRQIVTNFDAFVRFYGNVYDDGRMYADHIIRSALSNSGEFEWNDVQRRSIALKSAQVLVMYFGALQPLYEAASECETISRRNLLKQSGDKWDQGAALLIGSLEGTETNGTEEGYMYYGLAQEHCHEFGTCRADGTLVEVNDRLVTLLYTGRGALLSNSCSSVRKAVGKISQLLLIPVIQGALSSAVHLAKTRGVEANEHRAMGYVYSRALLPLVASADWGASQTLDNYLGLSKPPSTRDIVPEVFSSLATVYPHMGVDCELIGIIDGHDPCHGVEYHKDPIWLWTLLGSILGICTLFTVGFVIKRRRHNIRLAENNPRFITPETGELNHSMDLLEKAFSNNSRPRTKAAVNEAAGLVEDMYHTDTSSGADADELSSSDESSRSLEVI